jgi:tetratricopeptide (TPR) repeat protein
MEMITCLCYTDFQLLLNAPRIYDGVHRMTTDVSVAPGIEPTPQFNERCMRLVSGWRNGEIPTGEALEGLKALAAEADRNGHVANQGRAEHLAGYVQHYLGNMNISNMHYEKARGLFLRVGNRRRVATMDLNIGENYRYKGEFERARRLYRSSFNSAAELGDIRLQAIAMANEGLILVNQNEHYEARYALEQALHLIDQWDVDDDNLPGLLTEVYFGLAEVELALNHPAAAWEHASMSLQFALAGGNLHSTGLAYRILGDVLTTIGNQRPHNAAETPDEYYREALRAFHELGAQAEIGRTVFCHARSLAVRGRRRNAAQLFREAMVVFSRLGMTVDAARAAEAQLGVL